MPPLDKICGLHANINTKETCQIARGQRKVSTYKIGDPMNKELLEKAFKIAFEIDEPEDYYRGKLTVNKYNYRYALNRLIEAIEKLEKEENETI
jgi:hypothetical protein